MTSGEICLETLWYLPRVVLLWTTRYPWYPNRDNKLRENMIDTKNTRSMWKWLIPSNSPCSDNHKLFTLFGIWRFFKCQRIDEKNYIESFYLPKFDEELECWQSNKQAIKQCIPQKESKVFVVREANTVVDPRTVMVHFQNTFATHTAMMCSVWLHMLTNFTKADS